MIDDSHCFICGGWLNQTSGGEVPYVCFPCQRKKFGFTSGGPSSLPNVLGRAKMGDDKWFGKPEKQPDWKSMWEEAKP